MTQLRALLYADWRALVNDLRRAIRSPGRIAVWAAYVVALGLFFVSRIVTRSRFGASVPQADVARADYCICALLVMLALSLASGRGAIGIFRSRAEARFIIGSPVAAPLAIAYLQTREALAQGLRLLVSFMYFIFIVGPRRLGPIAAFTDLTLVLAIIAAASAVVVPRRLLPRRAAAVCAAVGAPLALLASAPALRDAAAALPPLPVARAVLAFVPAWHPGRVLLEPNPLWLLAVIALTAGAIAILASAGRDAYPELYALSIDRIDRLDQWRRRRSGRRSEGKVPKAPGSRVPITIPAPAGVLVFVWKSMVEFRRGRSPQYIAGGAALWCLAGVAAARLATAQDDAFFSVLAGVIINVILIIGISVTSAIAAELRRPLFWLAPAALFERLCALGLARIWRTIATFEVIAAGFALGGGRPIGTLFFAIGLPALAALLAGVGFAALALFPSAADARGPVTALRLGVSIVLLVPPFVLAVVVGTAFGSGPSGVVAAALLALFEAGALIGIAAWRLDGHVDRLTA